MPFLSFCPFQIFENLFHWSHPRGTEETPLGTLEQQITTSKKLTLPKHKCPSNVFIVQVREGGVQLTHFCIYNPCYFISSPNKLKICYTKKRLP